MSPPLITADRIPAGAERVLGSRDQRAVRQRIETVGWLLDNAVPVTFTKMRVGADAIAGLVPGIGDISLIANSRDIFVRATERNSRLLARSTALPPLRQTHA